MRTNDHYQNLNGEYKVSIEGLVPNVVENFDGGKLNIKYLHINSLKKGFCQKDNCSDYYREGDKASHPKINLIN